MKEKIKYQRPRGTIDFLPEMNEKRQFVIRVFRKVAEIGGFREIETPVIEEAEIFSAGVGINTDIVSKEMYIFQDRGERTLALRPESTAPIARAYIENGLSMSTPGGIVRFFYIEPMFRYERPQAGRYRQHTQYGVELIGDRSVSADVDVISLAMLFLKEVGLKDFSLEINSIGCSKCRRDYGQVLINYFKEKADEFCDDCKVRLEKNPLRIFDCKNEGCTKLVEGSPQTIQFLCPDCQDNFQQLTQILRELGFEYKINPKLVRGLDYYTRTVFEVTSSQFGSQSTIIGGGRYDGLIELLGGKPTAAVGFGGGLERIVLLLEQQGFQFPAGKRLQVYIITVATSFTAEAIKLMKRLRENRISTVVSSFGASIKSQLARASKINARYVLILGPDEWGQGMVSLKDLDTGFQETLSVDRLIEKLKQR